MRSGHALIHSGSPNRNQTPGNSDVDTCTGLESSFRGETGLCEAWRLFVGAGAVDVDGLVRAVQVSGDNNRLLPLQICKEFCKQAVPLAHAIVQPLQALACIWRLQTQHAM